jgi:predicted nucleotidyltransferase
MLDVLSDFPTPLHQQVARLAHDFFHADALVDTVLVVNSCARGQATSDSDLDLAVLVRAGATAQDVQSLETTWRSFMTANPVVVEFRKSGRFTQVHVDFFDGRFVPGVWDDGGGPDTFEVEIGNRVAYAVPLGEPGLHFQQLHASWLPYYDRDFRLRRLTTVREACLSDLEHVLFFLERGLHFPAFDYLYKAFQEIPAGALHRASDLSAFVHQVDPGASREPLGLPELYRELLLVLSVRISKVPTWEITP